MISAGIMTVQGQTEVRGSSYLGGVIIDYYSFSSVALFGTFAEQVPMRAATSRVVLLKDSGDNSRRRDCHFADTPSPSMLKHLLKVEGGAAE